MARTYRMRIKARCAELGITQVELRERTEKALGEKISNTKWSSYVTSYIVTPKADRVMAAADRVLTELEAARR